MITLWYLLRKIGKNISVKTRSMLPKKQNTSSKWMVFTTIPFQMAATIYLFYWVGSWLDKKFEITNEWGTKIVTLLGIFVAMYQIIRQVIKLNKNG